MIYNAYIVGKKRRLICEQEINSQRALDFLDETKNGLIVDIDGREYTREELEDAESIRPKLGVRKDSGSTGSGKVHEDTDTKLPDFTRYYPESSSERDN